MIRTGWPEGLLQDDDKRLSKWLAGRPDSRMRVRQAVENIHAKRMTEAEWKAEQERRDVEAQINRNNLTKEML